MRPRLNAGDDYADFNHWRTRLIASMRPRLNAGDDPVKQYETCEYFIASMRPRLNAGDDLRDWIEDVNGAVELQ